MIETNFQLSGRCVVPEEWKAGIGHNFRHYKGKMYRLIVLVAALVMIGCKNSEGMEEAENRRAQASAMVVAGMRSHLGSVPTIRSPETQRTLDFRRDFC